MHGGINDHASEEEFASDVIDVTAVPLSTLLKSDDSVLGNSIRRILAEVADAEQVVASHGDNVQ